MKDTIRQIAVDASVIVVLIVNGLANALPLNGLHTWEISDRFPVYFVPAGYVFSIWGVIYLGLIAYAVYQSLPAHRADAALRRSGWLIAATGVANAAWIFLWHYEFFDLTLVAMFALLGLLIAAYWQLGIGLNKVSTAENWAVRVPVSIYLGWISVAAIANVADVISYHYSWIGLNYVARNWTLIMLTVVLVLSALMSVTRRDIAFTLVIAWALIGIAVRWNPIAPSIVVAALVTAVAVLVVLVLSVWRGRKA